MATDKEVAAFVERLGNRLSDSPGASHSGRNRAAFIALRPLIEGALAHGYTMKSAWAALREEKKLSMSYQTFRSQCRRAGIGTHVQPSTLATVAGPHSEASMGAPPRPTANEAGGTPRGFRHERVPRKRDIYG